MSAIFAHLERIQAAKPTNFETLRIALLDKGFSLAQISRVFAVTKLGKSRYQVEVIDQAEFANMLVQFRPSSVSGRTGAALDGNSHAAGVTTSMLVIRSIQEPHPVVILIDELGAHTPRPVRPTAVVVENQENFLRLLETAALVANLIDVPPDQIEFIYGSGNQVTSRLNSQFLSTFVQIYCLFDVDLGGIRMFASLHSLLSRKPVFLYPGDIESRLERSKYPMSNAQRQDLAAFENLSEATNTVIGLMRKAWRMLEQETYLTPDLESPKP